MRDSGSLGSRWRQLRTPCRRSRREFLWETGAGFTGVALSYLLSQDGLFDRRAVAAGQSSGSKKSSSAAEGHPSPLAPRQPHYAAKAKSVIFLFMYGGVSQVDTFDPKPALAKYAGQPLPGKRVMSSAGRAIGYVLPSKRTFKKYGQSGVEISDFFPHLATCADEIAWIRSMHTDSLAHGSAILQMNTGSIFQGKPALGSWATYGLGTENQNLPAFVVMIDPRGGPISGPPNWSSGFMPAAYQGTLFRSTGDPIVDLSPPAGVTRDEQRLQLDLLAELNQSHLNERPGGSELAARIATYELAFRMQAHAPEAVDLSTETDETKRLYGLDDKRTEDFGRKCLLARRLVERGVRFVQVYSGGGHNDENWDGHSDCDANHALHAGETDQPIAALIQDLKRRGLLDSTLIVWAPEFGRLPVSEGIGRPGRDHNPKGFTAWMCGGGTKGGQVVGATDEFGFEAVDNPVHLHDLHATILHLMGLDHKLLTYFHAGRDQRLTDVHGNVINQIV